LSFYQRKEAYTRFGCVPREGRKARGGGSVSDKIEHSAEVASRYREFRSLSEVEATLATVLKGVDYVV